MATARETAQQQLGNLDLNYLNKEREVAQDIYGTSKTGLETNFNNLIDQINQNRQSSRKNFNLGRGTVAEESFMKNRASDLGLASSIAGQTGLRGANQAVNRMETGRQYSNLANTFYNDMGQLDTTEKQGRSQLEIDRQNLQNTLNQTLAGIGSREGEAGRNYNQALAQLAEQIQGRWDSDANAKASLAQQERLAAAARAQASSLANQQLSAQNSLAKQTALRDILTAKDAKDKNLSSDTYRAALTSQFGISNDQANQILQAYGITPTTTFNFSANTPYQSGSQIDAVYKMLGITR